MVLPRGERWSATSSYDRWEPGTFLPGSRGSKEAFTDALVTQTSNVTKTSAWATMANLHVDDIEAAKSFYTGYLGLSTVAAAYAQAQQLGYEIAYPLTKEAWGCTASSSVARTAPLSMS